MIHQIIAMRFHLIVFALFLPCTLYAFQPEEEQKMDLLFTSDDFSRQSPDTLNETFGFDTSNKAIFFDRYAANLRVLTDKRFQQAKAYRQRLIKCFSSMLDYLSSLTAQNNRGHQLIAAQLEWLIYNGAISDYSPVNDAESTDGRYTSDLIEQLGLLIGKAHGNPNPNNDFSPLLKRSLEELKEAEKTMTEKQRQYFQNKLAVYMTHFM
jgi:hypothetical protein